MTSRNRGHIDGLELVEAARAGERLATSAGELVRADIEALEVFEDGRVGEGVAAREHGRHELALTGTAPAKGSEVQCVRDHLDASDAESKAHWLDRLSRTMTTPRVVALERGSQAPTSPTHSPQQRRLHPGVRAARTGPDRSAEVRAADCTTPRRSQSTH